MAIFGCQLHLELTKAQKGGHTWKGFQLKFKWEYLLIIQIFEVERHIFNTDLETGKHNFNPHHGAGRHIFNADLI